MARAGRRLTDLQVLVEAFDRGPLDPGLRDWLFESLGAADPLPPGRAAHLPHPCQASRGASGFPADHAPSRTASTSCGRRSGRFRRCAGPRPRWRPSSSSGRAARWPRARESSTRSPTRTRRTCWAAETGRGLRGRADRAPAGVPAAVRGVLRVPADQEWRASRIRRWLVPVRDARVRVQHLRVVSARGVGVAARPGPARLSPGLPDAHRGRGSLPARHRQPRGASIRRVLLLPPPRVPAADRAGAARPDRGAGEDRPRSAIPLAAARAPPSRAGRGVSHAARGQRRRRSVVSGRAIWRRW